MKIKSIAIIAFAGLFASLPATANNQELPITDFLLSSLQNNQTLKVQYGYQGCFGGGSGTLEINQRKASFINTGYDRLESFSDYSLSNEDITKLDHHLYWIEKKGSNGGCTTNTTYNLQIVENGEVIASKKLSHNWCSFSEDFTSDRAMDFGTLIYKGKQVSDDSRAN